MEFLLVMALPSISVAGSGNLETKTFGLLPAALFGLLVPLQQVQQP
jgi:hypothetical protein